MDFTDEEIGQLLNEGLHDRPDLATHARAELSKAPLVADYNNNPETAALFLARICVLFQHVRSQLQYPSERDAWVTDERLRSVLTSSCSLRNPDTKPHSFEEAHRKGMIVAGTNVWLESQHVDDWRPGMASGSGWVTKYRVTPLGKRQVLRADQSPAEIVNISKPEPEPPKTPPPPPWARSHAQATAQANVFSAIKNEVSIAPQIVVNVHVPPHSVTSVPAPEASERKNKTDNREASAKEPSPAACKAHAQYQKAMDEHFSRWPEKPPTDDEVYKWLNENLHYSDRNALPSADTWKRELREFRNVSGTRKKHDSRGPRRNG